MLYNKTLAAALTPAHALGRVHNTHTHRVLGSRHINFDVCGFRNNDDVDKKKKKKKVEKKTNTTLVRLSIGHMLIIIQRGHNIVMHTVQKY